MRRMLDPKEAGGSLPSSITFDKDENRTVGKNLGVDGKLTLKSLVSSTNPDGDITKELGGGGGGGGEEKPLYRHHIKVSAAGRINVVFEIFNNRSEQYDNSSLMAYINSGARDITCSGCVYYESE